ncbi:MAG TPA: hypothetical protein PKE69_15890 [Pyrinomonadaceae bacterium]|nr:hypothetical protein [Pyrinomonadaceae bacterium]
MFKSLGEGDSRLNLYFRLSPVLRACAFLLPFTPRSRTGLYAAAISNG